MAVNIFRQNVRLKFDNFDQTMTSILPIKKHIEVYLNPRWRQAPAHKSCDFSGYIRRTIFRIFDVLEDMLQG